MKRKNFVVAIAASLLLIPGCTGNGELPVKNKEEIANLAGMAAALGWLAIDEPDVETVAAVKIVTDKVKENLSEYAEGGFVASLPGIEEAVDKALPGDENAGKRAAAKKLAKVLLEELDALFEKHPDWKTLGGEVAGIIAAFADGASAGMTNYERGRREKAKDAEPAT